MGFRVCQGMEAYSEVEIIDATKNPNMRDIFTDACFIVRRIHMETTFIREEALSMTTAKST